jgi:hypothetical protein
MTAAAPPPIGPSPRPLASPSRPVRPAEPRSPRSRAFAHESEAELARILDFYEVRWDYEPHVFPILWSLDGAVVESFAPDFYLPEFDLYLELTTLRQPLVRKKNRKLRRLRELYPDVRIKLLYARDFRALMLKFGKLGLADALSGSAGQVAPMPAGRVEPPVTVQAPSAIGLAGSVAPAVPEPPPVRPDSPRATRSHNGRGRPRVGHGSRHRVRIPDR